MANRPSHYRLHNVARVIRAVRKRHGLRQKPFADLFQTTQSTISKYEKGVNEVGLFFWNDFCSYFNIDPLLTLKTGFVELDSKNTKLQSAQSLGLFKIPYEFSYLQGSTVRTCIPFLKKLELTIGAEKLEKLLQSMRMDPDYFYILDNPINLNFIYKLIKHLGFNKDLTNVLFTEKDICRPEIHGSFSYQFDKSKNGLELIERVLRKSKKYECNCNYSVLEQNGSELLFEIRANEHYNEFKEEQPIIDYLWQYRLNYFKHFQKFNQHSFNYNYHTERSGKVCKIKVAL